MELAFNQPKLMKQPENEFLDGLAEKDYIENLAKEVLAEVLALEKGKDIYKFAKVWRLKSAGVSQLLSKKKEFYLADKRSEKMREIQDEVAEIVFNQLPDSYKISREERSKGEVKKRPARKLFSKKDKARLARQAQYKKWQEERRAGQTEEDSDLV